MERQQQQLLLLGDNNNYLKVLIISLKDVFKGRNASTKTASVGNNQAELNQAKLAQAPITCTDA